MNVKTEDSVDLLQRLIFSLHQILVSIPPATFCYMIISLVPPVATFLYFWGLEYSIRLPFADRIWPWIVFVSAGYAILFPPELPGYLALMFGPGSVIHIIRAIEFAYVLDVPKVKRLRRKRSSGGTLYAWESFPPPLTISRGIWLIDLMTSIRAIGWSHGPKNRLPPSSLLLQSRLASKAPKAVEGTRHWRGRDVGTFLIEKGIEIIICYLWIDFYQSIIIRSSVWQSLSRPTGWGYTEIQHKVLSWLLTPWIKWVPVKICIYSTIQLSCSLLAFVDVGLEASGFVTRVAPDVTDIMVDDKVAFGEVGALRSSAVIHHTRCKVIPDELSMDDAATMMVVFSTVFYCLFNVATIREGQSIFIHSACGGVGLAAIQVCRQIGVTIYATVGSEEKASFLVEDWNIPRNRIFTSRSPEFVPGLMRETSGQGVDVVLNSLPGDLLRASWMCVAEFGKLIELGKRDLMTHGNLDLQPFLMNRIYCGVDLVHVGEKRPEVLPPIFDQCLEWYRQGKNSPIRPLTIFPASDISLAFRHMQQGTHMGKVVVDLRELTRSTPHSPPGIEEISFSSNTSYLLVGGMGGIGRALSAWMVDNGARNLVYLNPSAGQSEGDQAFIRELKAQDCVVSTIAGSVTDEGDVTRAIQACLFPIKGVVQLSGRIRDRTFNNMAYEDWVETLDSKVKGTWNLHRALISTPLDFFLMFSSTCSISGQTGQSNYAAANSFLDSFAVYRQQLGLPASVINPGVVEHRGIVSRDSELLRYAKGLSVHLLQDKELIDGVRLAMGPRKAPYSPLAIGLSHTKPLSELAMKTLWLQDARFSLYANLERSSQESSGSGNRVLHALMTRIQNDPRVLLESETKDLIRAELGALVTTYVPRAENMSQEEVAQMALNSLMSVEVRRWIKAHLSLELSLIEINRAGTVGELARVTLDHLKAKYNLGVDVESQDNSPSDLSCEK